MGFRAVVERSRAHSTQIDVVAWGGTETQLAVRWR